MLTIAEAMQRAAINGLIIRRAHNASTQWAVSLIEDNSDAYAYVTDDLEDAVLMGAIMRARRQGKLASMGYDWIMDIPAPQFKMQIR